MIYSTINSNGERIFQSLILYTVAIEGYEILSDSSKINKTIEEFANGGFEIIHDKISTTPNYFNHPNDYINFLLDWISD